MFIMIINQSEVRKEWTDFGWGALTWKNTHCLDRGLRPYPMLSAICSKPTCQIHVEERMKITIFKRLLFSKGVLSLKVMTMEQFLSI